MKNKDKQEILKTLPALIPNPYVRTILERNLEMHDLGNPKLIAFIQAYPMTGSIREAAIAAGIPEKDASARGHQMRRRRGVRACLAEIQALMNEKHFLDPHRLVTEIEQISEFDPIELFNSDGSYKRLEEMSSEVRSCIKDIQTAPYREKNEEGEVITKYRITHLTFYDKFTAVKMLGQETGRFVPKAKIEVSVSEAEVFSKTMSESLDMASKIIDVNKEEE